MRAAPAVLGLMRRIAPCLTALVCLLAACDDVTSSRPGPASIRARAGDFILPVATVAASDSIIERDTVWLTLGLPDGVDPCAFGDWVQSYDVHATALTVYGVRHGGRCLPPRVRLLGVPISLGANGPGPTTVVDHPYTVYVCQPSGPALQLRFRLRLKHDYMWKPSQTARVAAEWDSIRARDQRGELDRAASMRCPRVG